MISAGNPIGSLAPAWCVTLIMNTIQASWWQSRQQPLNQNVKDLIDRTVPELLQMYEGEDNKYVSLSVMHEFSFISSEASLPHSVSALPKQLIGSDQYFSKTVGLICHRLRDVLTGCRTDYEKFCSIAKEILEQKAICQQDPDQDADEEAPEDQAEYDSVLISSAGDLVAAMANALGSGFAPAFNAFYPLIAKYYVRGISHVFTKIP
jgi:hypothetical protein